MDKNLDNYLCKRFPEIFIDRNASMQESCMHWGFSCGNGWFHILNNACGLIDWHLRNIKKDNQLNKEYLAKIEKGETVYDWVMNSYNEGKLVEKKVPVFKATQVKEKFGNLRFYYQGGDEFISGVVSMAESMSGHTCEVCGDRGHLGGKGWVSTLCDIHRKENRQEKQQKDENISEDVIEMLNSLKEDDTISVLIKGALVEAVIIEKIEIDQFKVKIDDYKREDLQDKEGIVKFVYHPMFSYWDFID